MGSKLIVKENTTQYLENTNAEVKSAPIGIFDSGVGGLSIAKCITEQLPHENIIYIADSLHAPYGEKSVEFIIERVNTLAQVLINQGVKALVIACNTATVNAIEQLRSQVDIPIIGVEPAIKPAALLSTSKKVAILSTLATSQNQRFKNLITQHKNGAEVFIQPCPGLVEYVEQGKQHSSDLDALLRKYIEPLIEKDIDTLVLGCTHYPFLQKQIADIAGDTINIIETAAPVTLQLGKKLNENNIASTSSQAQEHKFFSSHINQQQQDIFSLLWGSPVKVKPLAKQFK